MNGWEKITVTISEPSADSLKMSAVYERDECCNSGCYAQSRGVYYQRFTATEPGVYTTSLASLSPLSGFVILPPAEKVVALDGGRIRIETKYCHRVIMSQQGPSLTVPTPAIMEQP